MIRTLKEEIINELSIWQETNAENCQLKIDIHHFQQRLKELDVLCSNCETLNAEIKCRKKRYSEQLTKISKLISEQNFEAANWAIILDEMVFVNRELFDTLLSTAIAERQALQIEVVDEEKYRIIAEKLVLKRIELRQELHSQMNSYESLRAQIKQTEIHLMNLQKAVDVYDAEYWQLDDTKHDLQSQIFKLQQLLRHSQRHRHFNSSRKSSPSNDDNSDKDDNAEYKSDKCLTIKSESNETISCRKKSKKMNYDIASAKGEGQMVSKTIPEIKSANVTDKRKDFKKSAIEVAGQSKVDGKFGHEKLQSSKREIKIANKTTSLDILSDFTWNEHENDSMHDQSISTSSPISTDKSHFLVQNRKLPLYEKRINQQYKEDSDGSSSTESFKTTPSEIMMSKTETKKGTECFEPIKLIEIAAVSPSFAKDMKHQRSPIDSEPKEMIANEVNSNQESTTDLRSSDEENGISSSKLSSFPVSDGEGTDLISESISLSDPSSEKTDSVSTVESDIKDHERKLFSFLNNSSEHQTEIQPPQNISGSEISTDKESDLRRSGSLSPQNGNIELWEEISERTFFRNIANRF
ncbi:unnamed protein product [Acanthocheilonema viteae]|uniref:Uncharacterized protein n=1 Tax=Acanthocheilonema viteae TaxID=6277 RepID=A0A498SKG7_ACAVI|nr:unnamed protein product [Acanthocheilonema viteae]